MKNKLVFSVIVVFALIFLPAGTALADEITLDLHNDTAPLGMDCPEESDECWHFVITPNDNQFSFIEFNLNLEGTLYTTTEYIENNAQTDNVFVDVPDGYTVYSLIAEGSSATIYYDGAGDPPDQFVLSHICTSVPEGGSTILLLGMGLVPIALSCRRCRKKEVPGQW